MNEEEKVVLKKDVEFDAETFLYKFEGKSFSGVGVE